jgi:uncharacterized protein YqgV (UPF0045/DUF77 family)
MTVIARFEVIPVREGSMADDIARALEALDAFDVSYELTATDTVVEADSAEAVFAAVGAAHAAVDGDRVITSLEVDDRREWDGHADERVRAVEAALGRPPRRETRP